MSESSTLRILLVEDNPGDARFIEEMLRDQDPYLGQLGDIAGESTAPLEELPQSDAADGFAHEIHHVTRLQAGIDRLREADDGPDVILLDMNLPDSEGLETLDTVLEHTESTPIVVLTGLQDRYFGVEALHRGAHEYLVKGEINSDLLIRSIYHAIERTAYEREIEANYARLKTLNRLNKIGHDVTQALIAQPTREEIERTACEQLATSELYSAAWVGHVGRESDGIDLRVGVRADGSEIAAGDDEVVGELASEAVETREVRAEPNLSADGDGSWRSRAVNTGHRSVASIPIHSEQALYGVLTVFSDRPDAFQDEESTVLRRLGEVIGHTINAVETKKRLFADTVVELELETTDRGIFFVDTSATHDCTITLDRIVPLTDEKFVYYITVEGASADDILATAAENPHVEDVRLIAEGYDGENVFEFVISGSSSVLELTKHDAKVTSAVAEGGTSRVLAEVTPQADIRDVVEAVTTDFPDTRLVARREVDRHAQTSNAYQKSVDEALTDRQYAVLQAAYFAGFFDWPRKSTGEEVAGSLDITASTFHQHLRIAEKKLLAEYFDMEQDERPPSES